MFKVFIKYPFNLELFAKNASKLMDVLLSSNMKIPNYCGGQGSCKKCIVKLISGQLSDNSKYGEYYLACKAEILSDVIIELINYDTSSVIPLDMLVQGGFRYVEAMKLNPDTKKINLHLALPEKEDKTSDLERLKMTIENPTDNLTVELNTIQKLPKILRDNEWNISVIINESKGKILDVIRPDELTILGFAVDIGTTTINSIIVNLENGDIIDNESCYNSQINYGADVISRIIFSEKGSGLEVLHNAVITDINRLINILTSRNNLNKENIYSAIFAGNTTMMHLFAKISPKYIRTEPYVPAFSELELKAGNINIEINPNANIYCFPNVGSYVGGDIISGILATNIWQEDQIRLFIDIGTNGEIALGNEDWLLTCACSAGPAFEGAGVKCGTKAVSGAIEKVVINLENPEEIEIATINSTSPTGICGSGMINIISELFKAKLIDRQGKFFREKSIVGLQIFKTKPVLYWRGKKSRIQARKYIFLSKI